MWSMYRPILRNHRFLLLTGGQLTSQLGNFVGYMAVVAILYQMTGASLLVGAYMAAQAVAGLLMGPLAGALVDGSDRRKIMILSDIARGALVLLLIFADSPWQVLLISMAKAGASAFFTPAKAALTPKILSKEELSAGFGLEQTLQNAVQIAGPVLGGLAVLAAGTTGALAADAVTFGISALSIFMLRVVDEQRNRSGEARETWFQGYREILANPTYARLTAMKSTALVGVWTINVVLVAYAYQVLQVGHVGFGLLSACLGAGAVAGSLLNGFLSRRSVQPFVAMGTGAIAVGILVAGAGVVAYPLAAYTLFLLAGVGIGVYNVSFAVSLQTSVAEKHLGRAVAGSTMVDNVIVLVGMAGSGALADMFGVRPVLIGGAAFIAAAGLLALVPQRRPAAVREEPLEADSRPRIVRVGVKVRDQAARAAVAQAVDGGENSISIGYDGK